MNYKTPGVYVEEVSLFPPSVAEVETAIPAFIGYTEKAKFKGKDLAGKAVEVSSLVEYQERFGNGPAAVIDKVVLNEDNTVGEVETTTQYPFFDSIRIYFANGGGRCYIVSVGQYGKIPKDEIKKEDILNGLAVIAKEDEPTMIIFPDATMLSGTGLYELQQAALQQAADLGDRFVIMDLLEEDGATLKEKYKEFRNNIGINSLPYGAAYTPYLLAALPKEVKYRNLKDSVFKFGGKVQLASLTEEPGVKETIDTLESIIDDDATLQGKINTIKGGAATLQEAYQANIDTFKAQIDDGDATDANVRAAFSALCDLCYRILREIFDDLATGATGSGRFKGDGPKSLHYVLNSRFTSEFSDIASTLNSYLHEAGHEDLDELYATHTWDAEDWSTVIDDSTDPPTTFTWTASDWTSLFEPGNVEADTSIYGGETETKARLSSAEPFISTLFKRLSGAVGDLQSIAADMEKEEENRLIEQMPTYKNIVTAVNENLTVVPPSGAIAGIYCYVDNTRGVWKAPANVSLSSVAGLTERIDNLDQEDLNVDVNAGKSINAIRAFAGRGIIVWGARTLAGNDNEWRYIPVRRFFNMVEESVKKSTNWAVFEPNDAGLWTKIKAMIENYLTLKWRDGALAGAKPEEAFFVHVGLGTTMTAQDILEGRLIVDIGMAVVRPAEFIILRFMHKMQES
jgi:phage tail sheath protein FI